MQLFFGSLLCARKARRRNLHFEGSVSCGFEYVYYMNCIFGCATHVGVAIVYVV
jgi:hypothetical protein